jgi:hypothetical protein
MLILEASTVQAKKVGCEKQCYPDLEVDTEVSPEADAMLVR